MLLSLDLPPQMSAALRKASEANSEEMDYIVQLALYLWLTSNGYLQLDDADEEFIDPNVKFEFP